MFLRDEVSNNSRQSHGRQEDALHPPLEQDVLLLVVVGQIEKYRLVHLLLIFPLNVIDIVQGVKAETVWPDS